MVNKTGVVNDDSIFSSAIDLANSNSPKLNPAEAAKSGFGDMQISKYLYETGLQNVFNDYEKNIAILSQNEQKSLQDAYYLREMSKKYLGEYASNNEIGDVSGNLLDIYSNYQSNKQDIQKNFGELEMNLTREFQQARAENISGILASQYGIEVGKLENEVQQIFHNITTGNTEGKNSFEYLDSVKDQIGDANYRSLHGALYAETLAEIDQSIQSGYYGYRVDNYGQRTRITDPNDYLAQYKNVLSERDFERVSSMASNIKDINNATALRDITSPQIQNEQGELIKNPDFIGEDFDFALHTGGDDVDSNSIGFADSTGNKYFTVSNPADKDEKYSMTSAELFEQFQAKVKNGEIDHSVPVNQDVLTTTAYNNEKGTTETTSYMYKDGTWHRLAKVNNFNPSTATMKLWSHNGKKTAGDIEMKTNGLGANTISVYGNTYKQEKTSVFQTASNPSQEQVIKKFDSIHGDTKRSYIYHDGKFYMRFKTNTKTEYFEMRKGD
jgi:hypothetical protein